MTIPPPTLVARLLGLVAPAADRRELLADLADEFVTRAAADGRRAARRWYRRQVWTSIGPLMARRLSLGRPIVALERGAGLDLRIASRSLRASPGFAIAVILMIGLAIGAHTSVYAVVDGLLLRPLPFGERSDRLVTVHSIHPTLVEDPGDAEVSYADAMDFRRHATTLERLELAIDRNVSVSVGHETERVLAASITPGLFSMLGVTPALGRDFGDNDAAAAGFEEALILSHGLWQSLFGGAADVIGRDVRLNGRAVAVVGVLPPGFTFPEEHVMWLPYRGDEVTQRAGRGFLAIGLLASGVGIDQARADLQRVAAVLADRHPDSNRQWTAGVQPMRDFFVSNDDVVPMLAAVTLLLLVACANVAGLVLARGASRERELGIRAALGSGRWRLVRLLTIEAALLAAAGGAIGLALAGAFVRALVAWVPEPPPYWATPAVDLRAALLAIGSTAIVVVLAGLLPAIRVSRVDGARPTGGSARTHTATRSHRRTQRTLVVAQIAASLALVVGGLLLSRSATALFTADGGFELDSLLSLRVYIAGDAYDDPRARTALVHELVARVAAVPGVEAVGATGSIPTDDGGAAVRVLPPGGVAPRDEIGTYATTVTSGFWPALSLEMVEGRAFTAFEERDPATASVVINQRLARRLWPGQPAVDRTFQLAATAFTETVRVVGVAPDLVYEEFGETTTMSELMVYLPYARTAPRTQALLVRAREPAAVAAATREAVRSVDAGVAVFDMLTMRARRAYNHWGDRFIGQTFSAFAIATVLLACIGAYGIAAYGVAERRREIGVRLAIGANRGSIVRLFLSGGAKLALAGALAGLPLALIVARLLEHELFGTSPWTRAVWSWPPLVLLASVLAASYLPARRASRTDPVSVLRSE
ncbi:MAG TPA: ADOP family duplicated permease [Vicinamibacterales bacterium]|nr:ADOP family duplicated permease [Vicinamibacterales bacterium]